MRRLTALTTSLSNLAPVQQSENTNFYFCTTLRWPNTFIQAGVTVGLNLILEKDVDFCVKIVVCT